MARTFDKYQESINQFNTKYGVNFSFEKYETQVLKYKNLQSAFATRSKTKIENVIYRGMFTSAYKECVENAIERNTQVVNHTDFFSDFEKLMDNYREYCKENGKEAPSAKGGWKNEMEIAEAVDQKLSDIKSDKIEYIKDKYLAGRISLRDMRATVEEMKKSETVSTEQLATAILYKKALESTVKERSFFWKVFHPIRNNAEQRDLKAMNSYLNDCVKKSGVEYTKATLLTMEKPIDQIKRDIEKLKQSIEKKTEEVVEEKTAELRDFLKTGYRPNLKNIDKEWNTVKPFYDAVQKGEFFGERNVANLTVKELLSKNYIRIQLFKAKVDKDGVESARGLLDQMESIYAHEDAQFDKANPDYAVPEIPVSAEKEKIEVSLDEPVADKSEKVDAPVKSAVEKNIG